MRQLTNAEVYCRPWYTTVLPKANSAGDSINTESLELTPWSKKSTAETQLRQARQASSQLDVNIFTPNQIRVQ